MIGISALNRWLIGIVTVVICVASPASAATVRLALEKGQVFTWNWKTSRQRTETGGQPKPSGESAMRVTLRVIDRTRDGYLLEIQDGRTVFDPQQAPTKNDALMIKLLRVFETLKVQFDVTRNGEIKDIVNFDEVKAAGRRMIENGAGDREMLLLMFESLACSEQSLKDSFLKDVGLIFYGTNVDMKMKKPVDFEAKLFNGGPLKATGRLSLRSVDLKTRLAEIHVEQQADKQSFIQLFIENYDAKAGKKPPKDLIEDMTRNGSMQDIIDVTISLDSGLATHAKLVRTSIGGNTVQIDQVEFTSQK